MGELGSLRLNQAAISASWRNACSRPEMAPGATGLLPRRRQSRRHRRAHHSGAASGGANRRQVSNTNSSSSRTRLPAGACLTCLFVEHALHLLPRRKRLDDRVALRRPMGSARHARFLLDFLERQDARSRSAGRAASGSLMPDSSTAAWYCQRLKGDTVRPTEHGEIFRSGCINVPSAPWPESPATAATRVSMPCSSGIGKQAVPIAVDQPGDDRGARHQAAQPGNPHQRFGQPGRNLEILGIRLSRRRSPSWQPGARAPAGLRRRLASSACRSASRAWARASRRRK